MAKKKNINKSGNQKLLKVFVWLSIISVILVVLYTIIISSSRNSLSILLPLYLVPSALIYIWFFYLLIIFIKFLYNKNKIFAAIFIIALTGFLTVYFYNNKIFSVKYNLSEIFPEIYFSKRDFLIHDDKLYYNVHEFYDTTNFITEAINKGIGNEIIQDSLNRMNLDQSNNEILCDNLKDDDFIGDKYFHFIKDNELYYSDASVLSAITKNTNRKINLTNCNITKLIDDYIFLKNTDNDNYIYMYKPDLSAVSIIKYNLKDNTIIKEKSVPNNFENVIINYSDFKVYYIKNNEHGDKNKAEIFNEKNKLYELINSSDLQLLTLTNKYLFLYDEEYIYKLDLTTNQIINKISNNFKEIKRLISDSDENYFIGDNRVYTYDDHKNMFVDILNQTIKNPTYSNVYHYDNTLIIDDNGTDVLIFDNVSKTKEEYADVLYSYDNGKVYIISKNDGKEKVTINEIQ